MVWNEVYTKCNAMLDKGVVLIVEAKVEMDDRTETKRLTSVNFKPLEATESNGSAGTNGSNGSNGANGSNGGDKEDRVKAFKVHLSCERDTAEDLQHIKNVAARFPGPCLHGRPSPWVPPVA